MMPLQTGGGTDLDDLSVDELDVLDDGVIQLDERGTVTFYNAAESRFSGRRAEEVLGRHFFREVAPCTHLPAFHGRFLAGVRAGALDEAFTFTFGFRPRPVRVAVHMRKARAPGRFWITVRPLEWLSPTLGAASELVGQRAVAGPVDADACAREPIHRPGAIQPHMVLLAADPATWRVVACSANAAEALGTTPAAALGQPLRDLFPLPLVEALARARDEGGLAPSASRRFQLSASLGGTGYLATAHEHAGRVLVELELEPQPGDFAAPDGATVRDAVARLRQAPDLATLTAAAAAAVRAITGFERVLVYRFDRDWDGDAVAESRAEGWGQSLLGLRFPASDIPAQARALYLTAPPRFVVDRDYVPVPVRAAPGEAAPDLSHAASRSLSPVHLEYQRNLGVNGSMSASIIVGGRLWGLVIGHHRKPHYVSPAARAAVSTLADTLALRLEGLAAEDFARDYRRHVSVQAALLDRLAAAEDPAAALLRGPVTLLDLFDATGAAVVDDRDVGLLGTTPAREEVLALADWLLALPPGRLSLATEHLPRLYPAAAAYQGVASGLLAAFAGPGRQRALLWFRTEVVGTVAWGGDPRKAAGDGEPGGPLLPRRSFERWVGERAGSSVPWQDWHPVMAEALAGALEGVAWRLNRQVAALNAKQEELVAALLDKERLLDQKDLLTREVDHRVKNSLQIVASLLSMQARAAADPATRAALGEAYARVMSVARVHGSLYQAEDVSEVDVGQTIRRLCEDLAPIAGEGRPLLVRAAAGLMAPYRTAVGLSIIAAELVTNAIKYAYPAGQPGDVEVRVEPRDGGGVCLVVSDQGRGLPPGVGTNNAQGGLGMRVVRAMLDQIGGRMQVDDGGGARFTVCA